MGLDECLHDGQPQAGSAAGLGVGFALVENLFEKLGGNARAVVTDPAFDDPLRCEFSSTGDNLAAGRVPDGVGNQVLKHPPQDAGVGEEHQVIGYLVAHLRVGSPGNRVQIVQQRLDERP